MKKELPQTQKPFFFLSLSQLWQGDIKIVHCYDMGSLFYSEDYKDQTFISSYFDILTAKQWGNFTAGGMKLRMFN